MITHRLQDNYYALIHSIMKDSSLVICMYVHMYIHGVSALHTVWSRVQTFRITKYVYHHYVLYKNESPIVKLLTVEYLLSALSEKSLHATTRQLSGFPQWQGALPVPTHPRRPCCPPSRLYSAPVVTLACWEVSPSDACCL